LSGDPALALKDFTRVLNVAIAAGAYSPAEGGDGKAAQSGPDVSGDLRTLAKIYRGNHQPELALLTMLTLHRTNPKISLYMREIADLHDEHR